MITLPRFELLSRVRCDAERSMGGAIHGRPDIFVKLFREDVGANLPFDILTDFETRNHISNVLLN